MEPLDKNLPAAPERTLLSRLSDVVLSGGEHLKELLGSHKSESGASKNSANPHVPYLELVGFEQKPAAASNLNADIHELTTAFASTPTLAKDFQDCLRKTSNSSQPNEQRRLGGPGELGEQSRLNEQSGFVRALQFLRNDSSAIPDKKLRDRLVADVVHQIAHPESIRQGEKGTCGLATSELLLATNRPDAYATAIADWIHQGRLVFDQGNVVEKASDPARYQDLLRYDDGNKERSLASKVFQTAAANLVESGKGFTYNDYNPAAAPLIDYESGKAKPDNDSGERLTDAHGRVLPWSGLTNEDQLYLLKTVTGNNYQIDKLYGESSSDLASQLKAGFDANHSPMIVSLNYVEGGHAIAIVDIGDDADKDSIRYVNTATSSGQSHRLSTSSLFDASVEGKDVVRLGSPHTLDGYVYREPAPLAHAERHYVEVLHAANS